MQPHQLDVFFSYLRMRKVTKRPAKKEKGSEGQKEI